MPLQKYLCFSVLKLTSKQSETIQNDQKKFLLRCSATESTPGFPCDLALDGNPNTNWLPGMKNIPLTIANEIILPQNVITFRNSMETA